jgi:hypothetical protein
MERSHAHRPIRSPSSWILAPGSFQDEHALIPKISWFSRRKPDSNQGSVGEVHSLNRQVEPLMKRLSSFILAGSMFATLLSTATMAEQPYMQGALRALQNARASLETAAADKGGHREKAIQLVDEAIKQVKVGMAVAR